MGILDPIKGDGWTDLKGPGITARRHGFCPVNVKESSKDLKQESHIIKSVF